MSGRSVRTTVAVYREGAAKGGWCCESCHRTFDHADTGGATGAAVRLLLLLLSAGVLLLAVTRKKAQR